MLVRLFFLKVFFNMVTSGALRISSIEHLNDDI